MHEQVTNKAAALYTILRAYILVYVCMYKHVHYVFDLEGGITLAISYELYTYISIWKTGSFKLKFKVQ